MKKLLFFCIAAFALSACSKDDGDTGSDKAIEIVAGKNAYTVFADQTQPVALTIRTAGAWTSTIEDKQGGKPS